jgi:hypothetical protein
VRVTYALRRAYRQLGRLMVDAHILDDVDQLYFLTHTELRHILYRPHIYRLVLKER